MKTVVIPAQITTVEDKIAGNFNLTQIMLLMLPVFWAVIVYTLFIPQMHFTILKLPFILIVVVVSIILSLRIKEKVVLNWLVILMRFNNRPKYFVFNKNDTYLRTLDLAQFPKRKKISKSVAVSNDEKKAIAFSIKDLVRFEGLISNPSYSFSLKSQKKGGLHVVLKQTR